jgi:hypothetical protein
MKNKILTAILIAWVVIWISFTARELFAKGGLNDYRRLLSRSLEGKRSYVTGDRFYEFLVFCNEHLPNGASYELAGIEEGSHDQRRAAYYLYPHMKKKDAEYLLDAGRYILKRK